MNYQAKCHSFDADKAVELAWSLIKRMVCMFLVLQVNKNQFEIICASVIVFSLSRPQVKMGMVHEIKGKLNLRQRIQHILEDWRMKPSKQKFQMLYNVPKKMFESVGVRVYSDMHCNWYSNLGHVMVGYVFSLQIFLQTISCVWLAVWCTTNQFRN